MFHFPVSYLRWFKHVMADFRKDGYAVEIFFVFADLAIMEKRSKQREKATGRQTDSDQVRTTTALRSVEKVGTCMLTTQ